MILALCLKKLKALISPNWIQFSQKLHIDQNTIDIIKKDNPGDCKCCLNEVLKHWLKRNHDCKKHGIPCWRLVCEAVKKGGDSALAEEIAHEYREKHRQPSSRVVASRKIYVSSEKSFKIANELHELRLEFDDVFCDTKQAFPQELLSKILDYLRSHITALLGYEKAKRPKTVIEEFQSVETISDLFEALQHNYLSWFNYNLIIKLVDKFLSKDHPLKDTWLQYEEKLEKYFMNSGALLKDAEDIPFGEFNSPPPGTKIIVVKVDHEDYTLNHLFFLRRALPDKLNIPEYDLYFSFVYTNSLHLEYWIPDFLHSFIFPLSEEQEKGLASLGVVEMSAGDEEYFYDLRGDETNKFKATEKSHPIISFPTENQPTREEDKVDALEKSEMKEMHFEFFKNGFQNIIILTNELTTVKLELTASDIKDIILNEMVTCNLYLITFLGLPCSGKSNLIHNFLKRALYTIPNSLDTSSIFKNNERGISLYSAALMRQRHNGEYLWFALTEFLKSALWCGSAVCHMAILNKYDIQMSLDNTPNNFFDAKLDAHFNLVYKSIMQITKLENNGIQQLLSSGAIEMNMLDSSDTNKGVKEFLTLISQHLNYNLGIICLSIDDIKELNSPTFTFQESKISYIIRQAVEIQSRSSEVPIKFIIMCSEKDTKVHCDEVERILFQAITIEFARLGLQPLQASVLILDPSSSDDMKKLNISLDKKVPLVKKCIKLSWLFLRDALNNMDDIVISYDKLKYIAGKLGIKEMEYDEFLDTFTKSMSILYLPSIVKDFIILRPVEFINQLSTLFKIPYGIEDFNGVYTIEQLSKNKELAFVIADILLSLGMALKTTSDKVDKRISALSGQPSTLLYIPLARSGKILEKSFTTSLYIIFDSKLTLPNFLSFFASELLNLRGFFLLTRGDDNKCHPNVLRVLLITPLGHEYIFFLVFHGIHVEVVIDSYREFGLSNVLEKILFCCQEALSKISSIVTEFSFKLALQCLRPDQVHTSKRIFEYLPKKQLCHQCETTVSVVRRKWKETIQKIHEDEEKRRDKIKTDEILVYAHNLGAHITSSTALKNFAVQLGVRLEIDFLTTLTQLYSPWQRVFMVLLLLEKKEGAVKKETIKNALQRLGHPEFLT